MINPLKKIVPVEERSDGVYITVTRENSSSLNADDMIKALDVAMVLNYDPQPIRDAIKHCKGIFERIGPLFEYYDPSIERYVEVVVTPLKAVMKVGAMCVTDNIKVTGPALFYCLNKKGVRYGIKKEILAAVSREMLYDKELTVAEGKLPVTGADAVILSEVNIDHNLKPVEKKNGTVDFRNIETITMINNGQVILKKIPAAKGEPGKTVTGEDIPANEGKDIRLSGGKNTVISDDGFFLLASKSGFVYKDGELINVGDVLSIAKDVDFSVGNIKYSGDILIKGSVMPGFTVETEGNIVIGGQVESARVTSRNGSVEIQKGILGKSDTHVSGKISINTEFVQEAVLQSEGKVAIKKFCLHGDITCREFEAKEAHSSVIGGHIKVFSYMEIYQAGNETGIVTKLAIVDKNEAVNIEKLKEFQALKVKLDNAMEPVKKQLKTKAAILKKAGETSGRMTDELKKWINIYNDLTLKLKYIDKSIAEVNEKMKKPDTCDGYIKVMGNIFPGTELSFFGITKNIKNVIANKIFRFREGSIVSEG
ncbi:MAG TPA: hypothetical protein DCO75_11845 [Fibrobacteres bacterium]|nr:hypothetical protein [Fibrobacterota bacterium]